MEAYRLSIQAYGECSILTSRINFNMGTMYEDRQEYYEAYNWFVECGETYEKVFCVGVLVVGTHSSVMVELRTHDPKVVSLNLLWACMLCLWARHLTLTCSSWPRCINGYWLRLGRELACCVEDFQLSQKYYKLSSPVQLLVKRRLAPLDALKSVPTQFTIFYLDSIVWLEIPSHMLSLVALLLRISKT